jgi:hypothetical protein
MNEWTLQMSHPQKIKRPENIDKSSAALLDTHSFERMPRELARTPGPELMRDMAGSIDGWRLAHLLQSIVLYDEIVVDSILFGASDDLAKTSELFPGVISGVSVDDLRMRIGDRVLAVTTHEGKPKQMDDEAWKWHQRLDSSEKQFMDRLNDVPLAGTLPREMEYLVEQARRTKPVHASVPLCCLQSDITFGRTHFYLELARELDVPLSADPIRSIYYKQLIAHYKEAVRRSVPEAVVTFVDQNLRHSLSGDSLDDLVGFHASLPPIPELVVRRALTDTSNLPDAVLKVRDCKAAIEFRKWCRAFRHSDIVKQRQMIEELREICERWKRDPGAGVTHVTRRVTFEEFPAVGWMFKTLGLHEKKYRDPIAWLPAKSRYQLFLNDLFLSRSELAR